MRIAVRALQGADFDRASFPQLRRDHPIETGWRVADYLPLKRLAFLVRRAMPEPARRHIPGDLAQSVPDEVTGEDQILPVCTAPAKDDVGVRMPGVVVIDRDRSR